MGVVWSFGGGRWDNFLRNEFILARRAKIMEDLCFVLKNWGLSLLIIIIIFLPEAFIFLFLFFYSYLFIFKIK